MWGANMAAEISNRGSRLFPEVRIQFRTATRSSQIALSPAVQASALTAVIVFAAALIYLGISQIHYARLVGDEKSAVARTEIANVNLQEDVADLRDRLAFSARDRAVAEDQLSALASQADALRRQLESTEMRLHGLEQKLSQREDQPPELAAEARLVEPVQAELAPSEANPAHREGGAPEISTEATRRAEGIAEVARRGIGEFERVLASAGINVARLFSRFGVNHAEGGPFMPPTRADQPVGSIVADMIARIRGLAKTLPLSTPLEHYQLGSRFGPRRDPFNGRPAFHTGLDFDAAYMSPVYASAPGIVTYAGYRGAYGKVVEIDHGNGITTLYGHMHRYTVSVGQRVEAHTQIGLLGSTGRASGPHVHYEVIVNGQPQDPGKFMELARLVPIAEK
jgi:murein DD-endopeptidase MepM/ murein hydrolase activator NlpD